MGETTHTSKSPTCNTLKNSRIPMFQRSPSLRLKGEKIRGLQNIIHDNYYYEDSSGDKIDSKGKSNATINSKTRNCSGDKTQPKLTSLTRSASLNDKLHLNGNRTKEILKYKIGDCRQLRINLQTSEYESLPSTPMLSPDVEDSCSVSSFRSCSSSMSLDTACAANLAAKKKKFVVHCPNHMEQEEYLTPTQRKDRQIRQLKAQLLKAKREVDERESEVLLLTKEMINFKTDKSNKKENRKSIEISDGCPREIQLNDVFHSNVDSGLCEQFDDGGEGSSNGIQPKDEPQVTENDVNTHEFKARRSDHSIEEFYKKEIEDLKRNHSNEYQEMKEKYNDRIETLLQKLSDTNIKYFDLKPKFDRAQELIKQQELQIARLEKELQEQDKRHHQMYLKMYKKGQEAAKFEHADEVLEFAHQAPKRVSVPELLQQLKLTEHELERVKALYRRELYKRSDSIESEMTLRFLKDVIYHFLTNKDSRDHLRAIENIMGYSDSERLNIERSVFTRSKLVG